MCPGYPRCLFTVHSTSSKTPGDSGDSHETQMKVGDEATNLKNHSRNVSAIRQEASAAFKTLSECVRRPTAADSTSQHVAADTAPCPSPRHLLAVMASSASAHEPDDERDSLGAVPVPMSGGVTQWHQFTANVAPVRAAYAANLGVANIPFQTMKYCLGCEPSNRKVRQKPRPVVSCSA